MKESSLADALVVQHKSLSELDDVYNIINWDEIEKILSNLYSSKLAAPSYPPLMMFNILILQAWYNLRDKFLEKQIARDLMFRHFIDVAVIEAKQSRKGKGKDGNNTQDLEAKYNIKIAADGKSKTIYGFNMHVNIDEDGFVKKMDYTSGNIHDSQVFDKLLNVGKIKEKNKTDFFVFRENMRDFKKYFLKNYRN